VSVELAVNGTRAFCTGAIALAVIASTARASSPAWIAPSPDELQRTAEPRAPNAPAIILSYEEVDDAESAEVKIHVRIKILTEAGLTAGTVELPPRVSYQDADEEEIFARTIHRDGSVVLFDGKPHHGKSAENADPDKTFLSMPAVEVGSILEYICHFKSLNTISTYLASYYAPVWRVQGPYFTVVGHFWLRIPGKEVEDGTQWVANLPPGATPVREKNAICLEVHDVAAAPDEPYMPPAAAVAYQVRFFYFRGTATEYWSLTGLRVRDAWKYWDTPGKSLKTAVDGLAPPAATSDQKLRSIYAAVMALENTDLTRTRSRVEDKRNGAREIKTIDDVYTARRGNSYELTLLFIAMARAAGFHAYPMAVASTNRVRFDRNVLSWAQLDSLVAIVDIDATTRAFDPGIQLCPYGMLAPWHTQATGFASSDTAMSIGTTPALSAMAARVERGASLTLTSDGSVSGVAKIAWVGVAGLPLRLKGLIDDKTEVESTIEHRLQEDVPSGVHVRLTSLEGLDNGETPLQATFEISGRMGTLTPRRLVVPAQFFSGAQSIEFTSAGRTQPVVFPQAHREHDLVKIFLPEGAAIESLPSSQTLELAESAQYLTDIKPAHVAGSATTAPGALLIDRTFLLQHTDFPVEQYSGLRAFFGGVAASDGERVILTRGSAATHPAQ
jgi:hypothetical protein